MQSMNTQTQYPGQTVQSQYPGQIQQQLNQQQTVTTTTHIHTTASHNVSNSGGRQLSNPASSALRAGSILSERVVEHEVRVPRKVMREEIVEKVIVVPEKVMREETIEVTETVKERIIEVARPVVQVHIHTYTYVCMRIRRFVYVVREYTHRSRLACMYVPLEQEKYVEVPKIEYRERVVQVCVQTRRNGTHTHVDARIHTHTWRHT